jgi:hypothetical protein
MRRCIDWAVAAALLLLVTPSQAQSQSQALAVDVSNASEPTLCAETDNVNLELTSPDLRRFTIEARHPAYMGTIVVDRSAPDFRNCDMSKDPVHSFTPRRVTLYEDFEWQLIGYTFRSFWRPNQVPVTAAGRTETGLHLLQLWTRFQERTEEVLVLYPADGYWRARPLPPAHLRWNAYGTSFLIGPVETQGRPLVDIKSIGFDPATRTFDLEFVRGGKVRLRLGALDQEHIALDVVMSTSPNGPFASIRSMFVTQNNADSSVVAWREAGGKGWREAPIMQFTGARATELVVNRTLPSRHNTSAPDMVFKDFAGQAR